MKPIAAFFGRIYRFLVASAIVIGVIATIISAYFYLSSPADSRITFRTEPDVLTKAELVEIIDKPDMDPAQRENLVNIYSSVLCSTVGSACDSNEDNFENSLVGGFVNVVASPLENPPASGIQYALNSINEAGFLPAAYAYEGIGFSSISGYIEVWKVIRNISYLILVLIVVMIGFMIMFRMQLNPQTVVSIENALPRIVVTMILITFSFPIAGGMIDLMYAAMGTFTFLLASAFDAASTVPIDKTELVNRFIGGEFKEIWPYKGTASAFRAGSAMFDVMPVVMKGALSVLIGGGINLLITKIATYKIGSTVKTLSGVGGHILGNGVNAGNLPFIIVFLIELIFSTILTYFWGGGILFGMIIWLTLLLFMFRIFFMLLTAYIKVIILVIFSPFILLFHSIPGKNSFGWWFKALIGELLTFPVVVVVVLAGYIVVEINQSAGTTFKLPFLYGFSPKDFGSLIGLGIVLIIPDLVQLVRSLLNIQGMPINFGIGTFFGAATATWSGAQQGLGTFSSISTLANIPGLRGSELAQKITGPTSQESTFKALQKFDREKNAGTLHKNKP